MCSLPIPNSSIGGSTCLSHELQVRGSPSRPRHSRLSSIETDSHGHRIDFWKLCHIIISIWRPWTKLAATPDTVSPSSHWQRHHGTSLCLTFIFQLDKSVEKQVKFLQCFFYNGFISKTTKPMLAKFSLLYFHKYYEYLNEM